MSKPVEQRPTAEPVAGDDETLASAPSSSSDSPLFSPPSDPGDVGRLGPYRIIKELGHGGMGAVYAALDTRLDRKLALKVMLPQFAANASAKERFLREARAAAKISHDNIVTVFEADERDGVPYIAMQFLQGYPLDEYIKKKGNPSLSQVLRIGRETAAGLAAAHKIGMVHRDIKPANLWLEAPNGRVKVLDFGLAKPVDAEFELTKSGAIVGTPAYMSPEQARGEKVDHRTDLFSLGGVLYRLCTGRLPFQGANTMAVLMALGTEEPPPVRSLNPNVPEAMSELIHQLLAKKPDARPQSADEVVKRIRAIGEGLSAPIATAVAEPQPQVVFVPMQVTAVPADNPFENIEATEAEPEATEEEEQTPPLERKPSGKKWLLIGAGVAAAILIMAIGGFFVFKSKDGAKKDETVNKEKDAKTPAPAGPGKTPATVLDPDRKAADYVFSVGGAVAVNGENREYRAAADLPKGRFTLTIVNLEGCSAVTDAGLIQFKNCKDLTSLSFKGVAVSDAGLANFQECKGLTLLDLSGTTVTDKGLANFKDCKNLQDLRLGNVKGVTDAGLTNFNDWKVLTNLDLSGTLVTDAGLVHMKNFPALTSLLLFFTQVTDAGLVHLKNLPALTSLWLVNTQVTDAGLVHLKNLPALNWLWLHNTAVSDKGLAALKECRALTSLGVRSTKVTPQGLADFHAAMPGCKIDYDGGVIEAEDPDRKAAEWVISISGGVQLQGDPRTITAAADLPKGRFTLANVYLQGNTAVTSEGLANFKRCQGPTNLFLGSSSVTDAGLAHLKDLTGLTKLGLDTTAVTDAGLVHLKECTGLMHLEVQKTKKVTDKGLDHLKGLKSLMNLNAGGTAVTAKGLAEFHAAVPGCKIDYDGGVIEAVDVDRKAAEWVLSVGGVIQVNGAEVKGDASKLPKERFVLQSVSLTADAKATTPASEYLKHCKGLTWLLLHGPDWTDARIQEFRGLTGLTTLQLWYVPALDLGAFKDCEGLAGLILNHSNILDAGLEQVAAFKKLTHLDITNTKVTDKGLAHLKGLKSLVSLKVGGTMMTAKGLADFQEAVPGCKIEHDGGTIPPKK